MKLIVGLGNVGPQYSGTRHNLGFGVVDMVAIGLGRRPEEFTKHSKASADVLDLKTTHDCLLVKPTTMMNLSGQAIGELMRFYKVDPSDIWLVYDDVDLQFGQLRIRKGGATGGGHNGVRSVIQHIGEDFWRIRLGVANQFLASTPTSKFVLDPFLREETEQVPNILRETSQYIENALDAGQLTDETVNLIQ